MARHGRQWNRCDWSGQWVLLPLCLLNLQLHLQFRLSLRLFSFLFRRCFQCMIVRDPLALAQWFIVEQLESSFGLTLLDLLFARRMLIVLLS